MKCCIHGGNVIRLLCLSAKLLKFEIQKWGQMSLHISPIFSCPVTYVNADIAAELAMGLQGHPQRVNISVLNGAVETFETTPIDCFVESLDGKSYKITAFTTIRVTGNMNVID